MPFANPYKTAGEPGKWYFGPKCHACGTLIPSFDDERNGTSGVKFAGKATIEVKCPSCGKSDTYSPEELQNFQAI